MNHFNSARKKETLKIKLAEIIRRESHPILNLVTISDVIIDRKLQKADIIFSCFGTDPEEAQRLLNEYSPAIRTKLFKASQVKSIPPLRFFYNKGMDHAEKIDHILSQLS